MVAFNTDGEVDVTDHDLHEQTVIRWKDKEDEVDIGIAPLILELWKAGCNTMQCCQENRPGIAWVAFPTIEDARLFLNIVARHEIGLTSLYNRMGKAGIYDDDVEGKWSYKFHLWDYAVRTTGNEDDGYVETSDGPSDFRFLVCLRFPITDIPTLLSRLREFNE